MSAEEMAATSSFIKRAYDAQLAHAHRIQNKQLRDTVLDFVLNPAAAAYGHHRPCGCCLGNTVT
jgi:hypothetical protein